MVWLVELYKHYPIYKPVNINVIDYNDYESRFHTSEHKDNAIKIIKFLISLYKNDINYKPLEQKTINNIFRLCYPYKNLISLSKYLLSLHLIDNNYSKINVNHNNGSYNDIIEGIVKCSKFDYPHINEIKTLINMTRFSYCNGFHFNFTIYKDNHHYKYLLAFGIRNIMYNKKIVL